MVSSRKSSPHKAFVGRDTKARSRTSKVAAPNRSYRAPALEKGLDILELLAAHRQPLALHEITRALGRSSSELFRMMHVLKSRGYIEPTLDGEGYVLTDRLFSFAQTLPPTRMLIDVAQPIMRELAERTLQSVHVSVATGAEIVVLTQVEAPGDLGYSVRVGHHKPLKDSTSGLVLFAFQAPDVRESWLEHHGFDRLDGVNTFLAKAEQVRQLGFATAPSNLMEGVTDMSAAIRSDEGAAAALTIPYVQRKSPSCTQEETIAALMGAAKLISDKLKARS